MDLDSISTHSRGAIFRILKFKRQRRAQTNKILSHFLNKTTTPGPVNDYTEFDRDHPALGSGSNMLDISLQCLDAKSLLILARDGDKLPQYRELGAAATTTTSSQYSSSLDLEWEHEYGGGGGGVSNGGGSGSIENACGGAIPHPSSSNQMVWFNINAADATGVRRSPSLSSNSSEKKDNSVECSAKMLSIDRGGHAKPSSWSHISTPDSMEWDVDEEDHKLKSEVDGDSVDLDTRELLYEIEQLKNRVLKETGNHDYLDRMPQLQDEGNS